MPFQLEASEKTTVCDDNEMPRFQNSYRTEPRNPVKCEPMDEIVASVMNSRLDEFAFYDDDESSRLCGDIASEIRRRVRKLNFDRHKIVVTVTIVEKASQSLRMSLGYLWDSDRDDYSTFTYEGRTFHATCCVLGLYYE